MFSKGMITLPLLQLLLLLQRSFFAQKEPFLGENIWKRNRNTETVGSPPGIRLGTGIDVKDNRDSENRKIWNWESLPRGS